jgi:hypothetical protein
MNKEAQFGDLLGKTIISIDGASCGSESIQFLTSDGKEYLMYHDQDCCESVRIEDICGDVVDLIGSPIVQADEETNFESFPDEDVDDSFTWTFYRIATAKGLVVLRWLGQSNGYYSESVDFIEIS